MTNDESIKIGIVDDHKLFRKGIISLIEFLKHNYQIVLEADNGLQLQKKLDPENLPDVILMDVSMPEFDGFDSVDWLKINYPSINVLVLSMLENEGSIVRMLKLGVMGYLCKDVEPAELDAALQAVANKDFYYTDFITGKLVHALQIGENGKSPIESINEREMQFIKLACSELTYKEIADKMFLSPKTIDGYRNSLFEKLTVKSRVGLVLYDVKYGIVKL